MSDHTPTLTDQITALADARAEQADLDAQYKAAQQAFEQQHAALIEARAAAKQKAAELEAQIRETASAQFDETGEVSPHAAITIKQYAAAEFDRDAAREWAIRNMPALLVLDTKAYDKLLRTVRDNKTLMSLMGTMPGEVSQQPKTTLSRDLSAYRTPEAAPAEVA